MRDQKDCSFQSYDGTRLEGTLAVPDGRCQKLALLVHGITSSRDELGLFSGLSRHLAGKGVASFRFDYRCHGANEEPMHELTLAGIVNDIEAACQFASRVVRPSHVHPVGMSFGGGLTAFWAGHTQVAVESVVLLAPVVDYQEDILGQHGLLAEGRLSDSAAKSLLNNGYVETDGIQYGPALINELPHIDGVDALEALTCPTLILHGDADSIVPFSLSVRFAGLNSGVQLVNIAGTDHGFGVPDDEDLTSPKTKERHEEVFEKISGFILSEA